MHESNSYTNIFSVMSNIISVVLSLSVSKHPHSAPLRLFFFCWVCYSIAISTVFQAYLTTFLIEPGYVEPIKTVEQMLASDMKFGFHKIFELIFKDTQDSTDSTILENAVRCTDYNTCLKWATDYHNISTIVSDFTKLIRHALGHWTDENNRPLACELEYGGVKPQELLFGLAKKPTF
jgi:hypothetical protein